MDMKHVSIAGTWMGIYKSYIHTSLILVLVSGTENILRPPLPPPSGTSLKFFKGPRPIYGESNSFIFLHNIFFIFLHNMSSYSFHSWDLKNFLRLRKFSKSPGLYTGRVVISSYLFSFVFLHNFFIFPSYFFICLHIDMFHIFPLGYSYTWKLRTIPPPPPNGKMTIRKNVQGTWKNFQIWT